MEKLSIQKTNLCFAIFMGIYLAISYCFGMYMPDTLPFWCQICISEVAILSPIIAILLFFRLSPKKILMLDKTLLWDFLLTYIAAYCLMPLIYLLNLITSLFATNYVNNLADSLVTYPLGTQLLLMALLPALAEEFIFRGFFYGSYRRRNYLGAAFMSGIFFGLAHMNINQFAYAFVIGIAFCFLYEASGNIFIPVTAHFAINANTVFLLQAEGVSEQLSSSGEASADISQIPFLFLLYAIVALLALAVVGILLFGKILKKIATHNQRLDQLKSVQAHPFVHNMDGKFIDFITVATFLILISYMILLELPLS